MKPLSFMKILPLTIMFCFVKTGLGQADITHRLDNVSFEVSEVVDNTVLDSMRGGFITGDGVRLDVGVQKASYIDGVLQVQNAFRAEDVANFNKGLGGQVSAQELQNTSSAFNSLIQNNLDQKTIQNFTVIDVNVRNFDQSQAGFVEAIRGLQDIHTIR